MCMRRELRSGGLMGPLIKIFWVFVFGIIGLIALEIGLFWQMKHGEGFYTHVQRTEHDGK